MYNVIASVALDVNWEDRQSRIVVAAGRDYDRHEATRRDVTYVWVVKTLKGAQSLQKRLRKVDGVRFDQVTFREHSSVVEG